MRILLITGCIFSCCKSFWLHEYHNSCTDLNHHSSWPCKLHKHWPKRHPLPAGFTGMVCYHGWDGPYNPPFCVVLIFWVMPVPYSGVLSPDQSALLTYMSCRETGMLHPLLPPGYSQGRCSGWEMSWLPWWHCSPQTEEHPCPACVPSGLQGGAKGLAGLLCSTPSSVQPSPVWPLLSIREGIIHRLINYSFPGYVLSQGSLLLAHLALCLCDVYLHN